MGNKILKAITVSSFQVNNKSINLQVNFKTGRFLNEAVRFFLHFIETCTASKNTTKRVLMHV